MRLLTIALSLALATTAAHASSDDAWAEFSRAVAETCAASSGLDNPRVSTLIQFDDTLNKVATLVTGTHPQPHMKGAAGTMLCIYDKLTQKAWIDEAVGWSAQNYNSSEGQVASQRSACATRMEILNCRLRLPSLYGGWSKQRSIFAFTWSSL